MPFMTNEFPCKVCGEKGKITRTKWHKQNQKYYLQSTCRDCEREQFKNYQKQNLALFRELNKKAYLKQVGKLRRVFNRTEEDRKQRAADKALRRATRAKQARVSWDKELTEFVYLEAHKLRKLRNSITGFDWHVDHIVPLKGTIVCGLHVWNNFAVIPKVDNLRKGNYHPIHV